MTLTHVITQTHKHYPSIYNSISVDEARASDYPLVADCGTVWIPGQEHETKALPMCAKCTAVSDRPVSAISLQPHYVYRCYDAEGRLIYVGCSGVPRQRMEQHRLSSWWFDQVERIRYVVFPNKQYALDKEREAIAEENPRWNLRGRQKALWAAEDYEDVHFALMKTGASDKRVQRHADEARRRYDLDLLGAVS